MNFRGKSGNFWPIQKFQFRSSYCIKTQHFTLERIILYQSFANFLGYTFNSKFSSRSILLYSKRLQTWIIPIYAWNTINSDNFSHPTYLNIRVYTRVIEFLLLWPAQLTQDFLPQSKHFLLKPLKPFCNWL